LPRSHDPRVTRLALELLPEVRRFCRSSGGCPSPSLDGGRERVISLLEEVAKEEYHGTRVEADPSAVVPGALWVDERNAALPEIAGGLRPARILPNEEAGVIRDMPRSVLLPQRDWPADLPVACNRVHPRRRKALYRRLLAAGLAVLLPASKLPVDPVAGRVLVGGLFGVPKKGKAEVRLILDRRPQNSVNRRLRWATLPQPCQLRHIILDRTEGLRGDGDDLRVYF